MTWEPPVRMFFHRHSHEPLLPELQLSRMITYSRFDCKSSFTQLVSQSPHLKSQQKECVGASKTERMAGTQYDIGTFFLTKRRLTVSCYWNIYLIVINVIFIFLFILYLYCICIFMQPVSLNYTLYYFKCLNFTTFHTQFVFDYFIFKKRKQKKNYKSPR